MQVIPYTNRAVGPEPGCARPGVPGGLQQRGRRLQYHRGRARVPTRMSRDWRKRPRPRSRRARRILGLSCHSGRPPGRHGVLRPDRHRRLPGRRSDDHDRSQRRLQPVDPGRQHRRRDRRHRRDRPVDRPAQHTGPHGPARCHASQPVHDPARRPHAERPQPDRVGRDLGDRPVAGPARVVRLHAGGLPRRGTRRQHDRRRRLRRRREDRRRRRTWSSAARRVAGCPVGADRSATTSSAAWPRQSTQSGGTPRSTSPTPREDQALLQATAECRRAVASISPDASGRDVRGHGRRRPGDRRPARGRDARRT